MQRTAVSPAELADELMTFLMTTMRTAQGEVFKLVEEHDLTMTQLKMLFVLEGTPHEPTPSELARMIGLSAAAAGRAVDALVRRGIVSRRDDDTDRRVKRLALTADGGTMVGRISAARRQGLIGLVEPLTPRQRDALSAALEPLLPSDAFDHALGACASKDPT
jgi:DNA-binding MarR family transcriptional regulator